LKKVISTASNEEKFKNAGKFREKSKMRPGKIFKGKRECENSEKDPK